MKWRARWGRGSDLQDPRRAEAFGRAIAAHFLNDKFQLVASPAIGGLIIGHEVARALGTRFRSARPASGRGIWPRDCRALFKRQISIGGFTGDWRSNHRP